MRHTSFERLAAFTNITFSQLDEHVSMKAILIRHGIKQKLDK